MNPDDFQATLLSRADRVGVDVDVKDSKKLFRYVELLRHWNKTINLTALALDPLTDEAIDRLLIEPLAVAHRLPDVALRWWDLGSGGGSPAVPIKISRPDFHLTMVESKSRKTAFLREVVRELSLGDTRVETARFETLLNRADCAGSASLITVRAVKLDAALLAVCTQLLQEDGLLVPFGLSGTAPRGFVSDGRTGFLRRCST